MEKQKQAEPKFFPLLLPLVNYVRQHNKSELNTTSLDVSVEVTAHQRKRLIDTELSFETVGPLIPKQGQESPVNRKDVRVSLFDDSKVLFSSNEKSI